METRMKLGEYEFEMEGPEKEVLAALEFWKQHVSALIGGVAAPKTTTNADGSKKRPPGRPRGSKNRNTTLRDVPSDDQLLHLYKIDKKQGAISLRALPNAGDDRDVNILVLLIYGYKLLASMNEVSVGVLIRSAKASGAQMERLDRITGQYVKDGYLVREGRGRGGKYQLTDAGEKRAEALARSLISASSSQG